MVPVKVIHITEIPPARRHRDSPIKHSAEWLEVLAQLSGLTPGQAIAIEFTSATLQIGKSVPERFQRLLKGMYPELRVFFRGKDAKGNPVLYVQRA